VTRDSLERSGIAATVGLWAVSLALPALRVGGGPALRGVEVLSRGWQAFDAGVYAWLANPLFVTAAVLCWQRLHRAAGVFAGIACVLAMTSFAAADVAARGGAPVPEFAFQGGFYVWLASHFALLLCSWALVVVHGDGRGR
jgi:hypothetical protein